MATFAKLTSVATGRALWINLDHVTELYAGEGVTGVTLAGGERTHYVKESPEQIAHLAYAEHPVVAAAAR